MDTIWTLAMHQNSCNGMHLRQFTLPPTDPAVLYQLQFLSNQDECMWNEPNATGGTDLLGVQSCTDQGLVDGLNLGMWTFFFCIFDYFVV